MLLFNTYLAFLVVALAAWLVTIVVELRGAPSSANAEEGVLTD